MSSKPHGVKKAGAITKRNQQHCRVIGTDFSGKTGFRNTNKIKPKKEKKPPVVKADWIPKNRTEIVKMKNTTEDLNNHLMSLIEEMNDDSMSDEQIEKTVRRSKAISDVARTIIENNRLVLDASKAVTDGHIVPRHVAKIQHDT